MEKRWPQRCRMAFGCAQDNFAQLMALECFYLFRNLLFLYLRCQMSLKVQKVPKQGVHMLSMLIPAKPSRHFHPKSKKI
jgi:hypothetical protein